MQIATLRLNYYYIVKPTDTGNCKSKGGEMVTGGLDYMIHSFI